MSTYTITLSEATIKQLILAVDLAENTLEGVSDQELKQMHLGINREEMFAIADVLEEMISAKAGA
jgi:hypothetical protein